jgi:plastocyanin
MTLAQLTRYGAVVALSAVITACNKSTPTYPSTGGGSTGTIAATITITAAGVSPREVTVAPGSRVNFVNNNSQAHDMASDPHPAHTTCPEINVGFIQPGQSRATQNLNTVRVCGFHDHNNPFVASLTGTIRVQ